MTNKGFLIVSKDVLPDYFLKVVEAKRLIENGECEQVIDAVHRVGISRSTFYKYRDKVLELAEAAIGRKASIMLQLSHKSGMLSKVLNALSDGGANILTITQSLPIRDKASIMLSVDLERLNRPSEVLLNELEKIEGVDFVKIIAIE